MPADAALCLADSILGTSLFSSVAPDDFGVFMRAFITMFRVASGKRRTQAPTARCCAYCVQIFTAPCSLLTSLGRSLSACLTEVSGLRTSHNNVRDQPRYSSPETIGLTPSGPSHIFHKCSLPRQR